MNTTLPAVRCAFPIALAAIIAGCATSPDLPTASTLPLDRPGPPAASGAFPVPGGALSSTAGGFYPLQLGNHWLFHEQVVTTVELDDGPSGSRYEERTIDLRLVCLENRDGRTYTVEQVGVAGPFGGGLSWNRLRQDRTGLYEADVSVSELPSCALTGAGTANGGGAPVDAGAIAAGLVPNASATTLAAFQGAVERLHTRRAIVASLASPTREAGSAATGELTRLSYPLRAGARWIIRNGPDITFTAMVEGVDLLDLGVGRLRGFRIRLGSTFLGPADVARVWYGPSGYLQLVAHYETDAVDKGGNVVGRAILDDRETLVFLQLAGRAFAFTPIGPLGGRDTTGGGRR